MGIVRSVWVAVRSLVRRSAVERELEEEISFHLEMESRRHERAGASPAEARRRALASFGGVDRHAEAARDVRGVNIVDEVRRNLRLAFRSLLRHPGFTVVAVATLALGIGANTAIFSVVDAVLLRPLPFADAERLVVVWGTDRASGTVREPNSYPDFEDLRARSSTLEALSAIVGGQVTWIPAGGEAQRVSALAATHDFLPMLGIRPVMGRHVTAEEDLPGAERVVLVGEGFWREALASDPAVLGRIVHVNGGPHRVIGVVPDDAQFGIDQVNAAAAYGGAFRSGGRIDVWLPLRTRAETSSRDTHPYFLVGRLDARASVSTAQAELAGIATELEATYDSNADRGVNVEPLADVALGRVRPALLVLLGAVALVLLVACVNVANLLLARGSTRAREVAVRSALGAGGRRIAGQFITDSLVLVLFGAAAGLLVAFASLRALVAFAPGDIPRLHEIGLDLRVLGFTAAIAVVVGVLFGLVPTLQARRIDLQATLRDEGGRSSAGRRRRGLRGALVVAELALAVVLVIGAGLVLGSFRQLMQVDPGFRVDDVLKAQYNLPPSRYPRDFAVFPDWPRVNGFHAELMRRAREVPGVEAVAVAGSHPLDIGLTNSFLIVGRESEASDQPEIRIRQVSDGYFDALGLEVLSGRVFTESDQVSAPLVAVLNRAAVERFFPDVDPIGRQLRWWGQTRTIVGVIGNERFAGLTEAAPPAVYAPLAQAPVSNATLLVRAAVDESVVGPHLRAIVRELDPALALYGVESLDRTLSGTVSERRFTSVLLALFGVVALLLALIGVHGVLSFSVAQRAREVGIRMALGASRGDVVRMIVGEGMRLAVVGVTLGLIAAAAGSGLLRGMLFGLSPTDPATFAGVAAVTLVVAALACWLPARRATRVDPVRTLRAD